jgi:hypothetical protein
MQGCRGVSKKNTRKIIWNVHNGQPLKAKKLISLAGFGKTSLEKPP